MIKEYKSLAKELATRENINFYSLVRYLPNPDPILKRQGKDITVYKELLNDARVGGCISSRKSGVLSLEWDIDRGKAKSRQSALIKKVFQNLDIYQIISDILDAVFFGYAVLEVIWQQIDSYILPVKVVGKPQQWFAFDGNNNLLLKTKENTLGIPVPNYKFLLVQHNATYENPYGFPELSRCFWPVTFKKGGLKFWVTFTEKYGMPYIIGKHPRGTSKEETDAFASLLDQMIQDAVCVIPDDSSVEILEGGKSASASIYRELVEYCDNEITIALLGQNLTTQVTGGSYAAAQVHMQVRKDLIDSDKLMVEKTLNKLIDWIYELNFSDGEKPIFSMYEQEDVDKDLAERDEKLTKALQLSGLKLTKRYFQKYYGFEDEDLEELPPNKIPSEIAFSEPSEKTFPDQQALDKAIDSLEPETLQKLIEEVLKPVLDLLKTGNSYEEIMENLYELYPDMSSEKLEELLTKAIYISELWGIVNARN